MIFLIPIRHNMNVVRSSSSKGSIEVLFSYGTPVACRITWPNIDSGIEVICTDKRYSNTTSKHISEWLTALGLDTSKEINHDVCWSEDYLDNQLKYFFE